MSYALVTDAHTKKAPGQNGGTTDAIVTTGADLIVYGVVSEAAVTLTDSKSNVPTGLTQQLDSFLYARLFYAASPTVGTNHTFATNTANSYPVIMVAAFSGSKLVLPFDKENGAVGGAGLTTLSSGSVSPSENSELVVALFAGNANLTARAINAGFTIIETQDYGSGNNDTAVLAYLIQTSKGSTAPAFSWSGSSLAATAVIATFKAATPAPDTGGAVSEVEDGWDRASWDASPRPGGEVDMSEVGS